MKRSMPMILAVTALVVAVFGSTPLGHAAAGFVLPSNSVGTAQLKASSVTGAKIKNGTLTAAKFKRGQLPAGPQGPKGDRGDAGPKGDAGPAGASGATKVVVRVSSSTSVAAGTHGHATAGCEAGERATGGGAYAVGKLFITQSYPAASPGQTPTAWGIDAYNGDASTQGFTAYVVCAS